MKINNFRGDLTDISAKKEALHRRVKTISVIFIGSIAGHAVEESLYAEFPSEVLEAVLKRKCNSL